MDFVEQLKSSIDIVKVIGEYVRLRRVGSTGRYLGLCPFHQEKTPSFNVHPVAGFSPAVPKSARRSIVTAGGDPSGVEGRGGSREAGFFRRTRP